MNGCSARPCTRACKLHRMRAGAEHRALPRPHLPTPHACCHAPSASPPRPAVRQACPRQVLGHLVRPLQARGAAGGLGREGARGPERRARSGRYSPRPPGSPQAQATRFACRPRRHTPACQLGRPRSFVATPCARPQRRAAPRMPCHTPRGPAPLTLLCGAHPAHPALRRSSQEYGSSLKVVSINHTPNPEIIARCKVGPGGGASRA
jgi:hypothetical protein